MSRALPVGLCLGLVAPCLLACGEDLPPPPGQEGEVPLDSYHGLSEENSWTWRDDGDTGEPESERLLKARYEEGVMDIRRGSRWVDGRPEGELEWSTEGGLFLVGWDLGGARGSDELPLAVDGTVWGGTVSAEDWSCTNRFSDDLQTWYAVFDDAVIFDCTGGNGVPGQWAFARGLGLVKLEGEIITLDMVSGW